MREYRPSGVVPAGGFFLLLIIAIIAGAVLGGVLFALDHFAHFYLVLIYPLFAGGIAGAILAAGVRSGKIRSPIVAGLVGIIAALVMYGVYHGASYYIGFRNDVRDVYVQDHPNSNLTDAQLNDFINQGLQKQVGDTGFIGYLKFTAQQGISIANTGPESYGEAPTVLQGNVAYGYYILEIILAAGFAGGLAWQAARQPFDEGANSWYGSPTVIAMASTKSRKSILKSLKDGDFQGAGSQMTKLSIKYPHLELWTRRSPDASSQDILLVLNHVQRRGRATALKRGIVSPADLETINRSIRTADANTAATPAKK